MPHHQLIVMPDDGLEAMTQAISGARKSLAVKMFLLTEPALVAALVAAHRRGVETRVILNKARRSGEEDNGDATASLEAAVRSVEGTARSLGLEVV